MLFTRYSVGANNGLSREEYVTVDQNKIVVVNAVIHFKAEDQLKYNLFIVFEDGNYNATIDAYPFRRIPPNALKSLIG